MSILIDENLPPRWEEYLAAHGFPAKHWTRIGNPGDADELIFYYAIQNCMVVITQDLDFGRMLALYKTSLPSVIQLRVGAPIPEIVGNMVLNVLKNYRQQLEAGCLVSIDSNSRRLRLLPLT